MVDQVLVAKFHILELDRGRKFRWRGRHVCVFDVGQRERERERGCLTLDTGKDLALLCLSQTGKGG